MRDLIACEDVVGITTNQPKSVALYAKEATDPIFNGSMIEVERWSKEECEIRLEV